MMLFLLSSGLSLTFGVMNILNFSHATLWLIGGYVTCSFFQLFVRSLGSPVIAIVLAIPLATAVMFLVGVVLERFLIRRMYDREVPEQLLMTYALILIFGDLIKLIWGVENRRIVLPIKPLNLFGVYLNPYFFIIIGSGCAVGLGLWLFLHRTRYGKIVRAAVFNRDMVSALGIRIPLIYAGIFGLGIAIATFSAGVSLPTMPIGLGVDMDLIIQCFMVVVIGGLGSILGTFVASLIVGVVYAFAILIWPEAALVLIFLILVTVLIWRPWGLFGTEMRY
jgi:branched-subunit amino acid ABC-type transport system permease component